MGTAVWLPRTIYGVDYSGAARSGRTTWLAVTRPGRRGRLSLLALDPFRRLASDDSRTAVNAELVHLVTRSRDALWAINFPFGLPAEALPHGDETWPGQFRHLASWGAEAYACGVACLNRALARGHPMHVRRVTDSHHRTPFDTYHYRIIYQTFHGMRDVLDPLRRHPGTCVLPFQPGRLVGAERVVVESCPSVTLKRLGLPNRLYKQATGGPLAPRIRRTRRAILAGLAPAIEIPPTLVRRIARDPGADALDAVLSALGAWQCRHALSARFPDGQGRARREGWHYA